MSCNLTNIRDEVYLRINVKRVTAGFSFANNFVLEKTWRPWETLEELGNRTNFPHGKVYILGGRMGDLMNRGRPPTNVAGPREYGVMLGFQIIPLKITDETEIDTYISFIEELERVCQQEVNLEPFSFTRIEYAVTPEGQPLDFIMQRKALTFECYFTAFYTRVLS